MLTLGIETSCDETGIAIYDSRKGLLANVLYSQVAMHARFGGVVPEMASRDHIRKALPLIKEALAICGLTLHAIDAIAYTAGPGLVGALLIGAAIGKSIGFALKIPAIPIHHLEAHLLAAFLEENQPSFPFIALLASGGHTQLIHAKDFGYYDLLGESLDDAAGEAFDKVAKSLKLGYPGGAALADLANKGDVNRFHFPRPMSRPRDKLNFSFSGLKTFAINTLHKYGDDEQTRADIAAAFQDAITDSLVMKCERALKQIKGERLVLAGGVSANTMLHNKLESLARTQGFELFFPRNEFCTDNGAMIAYAGYRHLVARKDEASMQPLENLSIDVLPRCEIDTWHEKA